MKSMNYDYGLQPSSHTHHHHMNHYDNNLDRHYHPHHHHYVHDDIYNNGNGNNFGIGHSSSSSSSSSNSDGIIEMNKPLLQNSYAESHHQSYSSPSL